MNLADPPLLDPDSGRPLRPDGAWALTDGSTRWPVVEGIPFLRPGRDGLRRGALERLEAGDGRGALALLLADQDDYARIAPPDGPGLLALIDAADDGSATLREAMASLNFGPVADYFAYRWSSPTYLSGLALLDRRVPGGGDGAGGGLRDRPLPPRPGGAGRPLPGPRCGLRQALAGPAIRGARGVPWICGDAARGLPVGPVAGLAVAFCHDAFYFLPEKARVVAGLRRAVGPAGAILIGHAHNSAFDHGGVAGEPRTPAEYAALLPGCLLFDDAELARSAWSGLPAPGRTADDLAAVEAVALAWSGATSGPDAGTRLGLARPHPRRPAPAQPAPGRRGWRAPAAPGPPPDSRPSTRRSRPTWSARRPPRPPRSTGQAGASGTR